MLAQVLDKDRFIDVHYQALEQDPIETVRRLYAHVDLHFTGEAETRMRQFLSANPKDKNGEHRYTLGEYGLDPHEIKDRFRMYRERFAIVPETA